MNEKIKQLASAAINAAIPSSSKLKYFSSSKKGELYELKTELNSGHAEKKKHAVKKVIANMTLGKDVSALFADVLKCMQTEDLELKKLVYLYLMNYAESQPDLAILAINTFCKDTEDSNPLLRALAIRTMGCIRIEKILDYLCEPLRRALVDSHPYVRKTAVISVAKLYNICPFLAEENGFISKLQEMISDPNPHVVSNCISALSEIGSHRSATNGEPSRVFTVNSINLTRLLCCLNECNEWGQITILDAIALYEPSNESEAEMVVDKILSKFQHINPSIVQSSIKVLVVYCDYISNEEFVKGACRKTIAPLISLLSYANPEIQWITLRNLKLILEKFPGLLNNELRAFFCKYNDPIYIKIEKLSVLVALANEENIEEVLAELHNCAKEIDMEFVSKSILALGQCCVKIKACLYKGVLILNELLSTQIDYIVQECIVVIKDLFKRFGGRELNINLDLLFKNMDLIIRAEARAALVWILGEHGHLLENSGRVLSYFTQNFLGESSDVQYQVLTACVKLYLRSGYVSEDAVLELLKKAVSFCENADLRDKAFIYWRLLSFDPNFAKSRLFSTGEKPSQGALAKEFAEDSLKDLLKRMSFLSSLHYLTQKEMEDWMMMTTTTESRGSESEKKRLSADSNPQPVLLGPNGSSRVGLNESSRVGLPGGTLIETADLYDDENVSSQTNFVRSNPNPFCTSTIDDLLGGSTESDDKTEYGIDIANYGTWKKVRVCSCQAREHGLRAICLNCGQIICEAHGSSPTCSYCNEPLAAFTRQNNNASGLPVGTLTKKEKKDLDALRRAQEQKNALLFNDKKDSTAFEIIDDQISGQGEPVKLIPKWIPQPKAPTFGMYLLNNANANN